MTKEFIVGFLLAVVGTVAVVVTVVSWVIILGGDDEAVVAEVETIDITPVPLPPQLLRVTVDHANGFVCYDNTASIACQPLWYGIPPPDAMGYIQSNIGRVFAVPPLPSVLSPTPVSPLNGMN